MLNLRNIFVISTLAAVVIFGSLGKILTLPSEEPGPVDLVAVLGGDSTVRGARYAKGRELVSNGLSNRLLLIHPNDSELKTAFNSVAVFTDTTPKNTWSEAQVVRTRMLANGWRSVLVVSDPPHMLRMQYAWWSVFRGTGLSFTLVATAPPWWHPWRWWQNQQSRGFVKSEVMKLGYYLLVYRFGLG